MCGGFSEDCSPQVHIFISILCAQLMTLLGKVTEPSGGASWLEETHHHEQACRLGGINTLHPQFLSLSPSLPVLLYRSDNVTCRQSASMLHGQNRLCLSGALDEQFLQGIAFGGYIPSLWQKTD